MSWVCFLILALTINCQLKCIISTYGMQKKIKEGSNGEVADDSYHRYKVYMFSVIVLLK